MSAANAEDVAATRPPPWIVPQGFSLGTWEGCRGAGRRSPGLCYGDGEGCRNGIVLIAPKPKLHAPNRRSRATKQTLFARHPSALPACARPSPRTVNRLARIRLSAEPPTKYATMPMGGQVNPAQDSHYESPHCARVRRHDCHWDVGREYRRGWQRRGRQPWWRPSWRLRSCEWIWRGILLHGGIVYPRSCLRRLPLTPAEARILLQSLKGDRIEALYSVALTMGLRQGEPLGLTSQYVDL
jgi:hypothetical protein